MSPEDARFSIIQSLSEILVGAAVRTGHKLGDYLQYFKVSLRYLKNYGIVIVIQKSVIRTYI